MKFHSEWLIDDPIEVITDLEKNLHSKDEIENLSTNENFSEIDKALFLIDKGQLSQKLWVVRSIESFMHHQGCDQVFAELIDRLPYWTEPAQEETGRAFKSALAANYFPVKYYENLLQLILHLIETETWSLQEAWGDAMAELAKKYQKRCLTEAFQLSAFSQTDNVKCIGGYVLASIAEAQKAVNCEDILKKVYAMAQDPSNFVRMNMCRALKVLGKVLNKKQIESQLVPEVLKLVEDDSAEVLESSLPLFCELMNCCSYQYKEEVIEMMKGSFFASQINKLSYVKLKHFGKIIVSLRLSIDEEFREMSLNWFAGFERIKEEEIRRLMAYNFPAMLYIVGNMNDLLLRVFKILALDERWGVKKIIAKQLGDVCRISNCKEVELLQIVKDFIDDSKAFYIVLEQFFTIAKALKTHDMFVGILIKQLSTTESDWRKIVLVLKELINFCCFFDFSSIHEKLILILIDLLKTSSHPVRDKSAKLLAELFYKNLHKKDELSLSIITQLGKAPSYTLRLSYIKFCAYLAQISSHLLFCKHFMPALLSLSKDHVKSVVYEFAYNYVGFRLALPFGDSDLQSEFRKILNFYLETDDKVLNSISLECDEKVDMLFPEYYSNAAEIKENQKIKYESEFVIKESSEAKMFAAKKSRKATIPPRGNSHIPSKRYSLVEIDKAELSRVVQKNANKRKMLK